MNDAGGRNDDASVAEEPPDDTTADLVTTVMKAAEDDSGLTDDARLRLLSALTGHDEPQADRTGHATSTDEVSAPGEGAAARSDPDSRDARPDRAPAGAFLRSITVAGFRGVGPEARLDLNPAPGLVVVAGRNGSGKSTFSEAVEVSLTRTSYRWDNKPKAWKERWRNLHEPNPCRIEVNLAEEGVGSTAVSAEWAPDADLDGGAHCVQRDGQKHDPSADPLGWAGPMETYRPLISYDELGGILAPGPDKPYDKLSALFHDSGRASLWSAISHRRFSVL